jgi:hypothetical protein
MKLISLLGGFLLVAASHALPGDARSARLTHYAAVSMNKLIQRNSEAHFTHETDFAFIDCTAETPFRSLTR